MGMMDANVLRSAKAHRGIKPDAVIGINGVRTLYRPDSRGLIANRNKPLAGNASESAQCAGHAIPIDEAINSYIGALEDELMHYRLMLEKMVQQRTERLDRRISVLESCNSSLGENYHRMHQMYLDLLSKTQSLATEMGMSEAA